MGLQQFEQRLERLVEGAFAKAFRGELQPVELGRRLTREMDLRRARRGARLHRAEPLRRLPRSARTTSASATSATSSPESSTPRSKSTPARRTTSSSDPVASSSTSTRTCRPAPSRSRASLEEGQDRPSDWLVLPRRPPGRHRSARRSRSAACPSAASSLDDPNVSRRHAQVRAGGRRRHVVDLGSTNGTKVNGVTVRQHRLSPATSSRSATTPSASNTPERPHRMSHGLLQILRYFLLAADLAVLRLRGPDGLRRGAPLAVAEQAAPTPAAAPVPVRQVALAAPQASSTRRAAPRARSSSSARRSPSGARRAAPSPSRTTRSPRRSTPASSVATASLWLEDLGSTNGTFVNEERLVGPARLQRGDRVKVGSTILEVAGDAAARGRR